MIRVAVGKPRPAVIVQADQLQTPIEILVCPFTTMLVDSPLYRLRVQPDSANSLKAPSDLMADKVGPIPRDRIDGVIGRLDDADMARLEVALTILLGLTGPTA